MAHPDVEAAVADADDTTGTADNSNTGTDQGQQDGGDQEINYYPDDPPADDAELPPTGEGEAAEGEAEEEGDDEDEDEGDPQVTAPESLNAEEREKFAKLPPEAREFFASTLQRREVEAQQGVQKVREQARDLERQAADTVAQTQRGYAEKFDALVNAFAPQPPSVDLARTNPAQYQYERARYEEELGTFQQLVGQVKTIGSEADQHFEAQEAQWKEERRKALMSDADFANAPDREAYLNDLLAFGEKELGYKPDGLAQHGEAQDFFNLRRAKSWKEKADKYDNLMRKRNQRPREADTGKFRGAAPAGQRAAAGQGARADPLRTLYPND